MKFFPIVPIKYLNRLAGLSSNQMVLAQWLSEKRYLNFYRKRREKGDFIILDNGACELRRSVPTEELFEGYKKLGGVDVVVLPDSNEKDNVEMHREFLFGWGTRFLEVNPRVQFMAVPKSLRELDELITNPGVSYIGLNRDFESLGRSKIVQEYKRHDKKFHLLGIRRNPVDEILAVKPFGDLVLGVDSSFPYRLFSRGRIIQEYRPYPDHDSMYQDNLSDEIINFCVGEFKVFLEWINE